MNILERLDRKFFERDTKVVANDLMVKYLVGKTSESSIVGKIIEVKRDRSFRRNYILLR